MRPGRSGGNIAPTAKRGSIGARYKVRLFCAICGEIKDAVSKALTDHKTESAGVYTLQCGHERTKEGFIQ
jgi:hypothetical protein